MEFQTRKSTCKPNSLGQKNQILAWTEKTRYSLDNAYSHGNPNSPNLFKTILAQHFKKRNSHDNIKTQTRLTRKTYSHGTKKTKLAYKLKNTYSLKLKVYQSRKTNQNYTRMQPKKPYSLETIKPKSHETEKYPTRVKL